MTCAAAPLWTTTESRFGVVHQHQTRTHRDTSLRQGLAFGHLHNAAVSVQASARLLDGSLPSYHRSRSRGQHGRSDLADVMSCSAGTCIRDCLRHEEDTSQSTLVLQGIQGMHLPAARQLLPAARRLKIATSLRFPYVPTSTQIVG